MPEIDKQKMIEYTTSCGDLQVISDPNRSANREKPLLFVDCIAVRLFYFERLHGFNRKVACFRLRGCMLPTASMQPLN